MIFKNYFFLLKINILLVIIVLANKMLHKLVAFSVSVLFVSSIAISVDLEHGRRRIKSAYELAQEVERKEAKNIDL